MRATVNHCRRWGGFSTSPQDPVHLSKNAKEVQMKATSNARAPKKRLMLDLLIHKTVITSDPKSIPCQARGRSPRFMRMIISGMVFQGGMNLQMLRLSRVKTRRLIVQTRESLPARSCRHSQSTVSERSNSFGIQC